MEEMNIVKKYTLIYLGEKTTKGEYDYKPTFTFGSISGPYYSRDYPKTRFDSEEEAIKYAYENDKWGGDFIVLPVYHFDNF